MAESPLLLSATIVHDKGLIAFDAVPHCRTLPSSAAALEDQDVKGTAREHEADESQQQHS